MHGADAGDIGEAEPFFGNGVQRDVAAVTEQRGGDTARPGFHDGRVRRVEARGVGGGEQQAREPLRVAQAVGGDAAKIGERVLEAHYGQMELSVMSGATNTPVIRKMPSGLV